jgi:hypothetical protein
MENQTRDSHKTIKFSRGFLITLGALVLIAALGKPVIRWLKAEYDAYRERNTTLTASVSDYQRLLKVIQAQQPHSSFSIGFSIPEKIFQTAISPSFLGRNNQYTPHTQDGTLACAWIVNEVVNQALGYRIGENPIYVPSVVKALDQGMGQRIEKKQTKRGDLAIANGSDYKAGLWHIGICVTDSCSLVLSNSPFTSRFEWLTDANFDDAFAHHPGETTFYRVTQGVKSESKIQ